MSDSNWVHLDVEEVLRATDAALLVRLAEGEELWLPRSQVADGDSYEAGDCDLTVSITEWIARQKGLGD